MPFCAVRFDLLKNDLVRIIGQHHAIGLPDDGADLAVRVIVELSQSHPIVFVLVRLHIVLGSGQEVVARAAGPVSGGPVADGGISVG